MCARPRVSGAAVAGRARGAALVQRLHDRARHRLAAIVAVYPFMKRVTYWPQIVLGLAFSWGALMGWAGAFGRLDLAPLLLYAGSIAWVIGYDTIYAHQDRDDDALIGIKSTALLFGRAPSRCSRCSTGWPWSCRRGRLGAGAGFVFALGLAAFAAHLGWQIDRLDIADPDNCLAVFKSEPRRRTDPVCRPAARRRLAPDCITGPSPMRPCGLAGGPRQAQDGSRSALRTRDPRIRRQPPNKTNSSSGSDR